MITFAVALRSGGDFVPDDAIILSRQVKRQLPMPHKFVCLADVHFEDPLVERKKLLHNWPGWWSVIELFRLKGPVIVMGLDTIVIDDISKIGGLALTCPENTFYMTRPQPRAMSRGEKLCSGAMIWNGDWYWLYEEFALYARSYISKFYKEQRYTAWKLLNRKGVEVRLLQDWFDGFYSYKNDVRGKTIPFDAKVIAFHGKPRPRFCGEEWAEEILNDYSIAEHGFEKLREVN